MEINNLPVELTVVWNGHFNIDNPAQNKGAKRPGLVEKAGRGGSELRREGENGAFLGRCHRYHLVSTFQQLSISPGLEAFPSQTSLVSIHFCLSLLGPGLCPGVAPRSGEEWAELAGKDG